jgi:uncharacterized protein YdhG (YjbR/CyaY superfamily)
MEVAMSSEAGRKKPASMDGYIKAFPKDVQKMLAEVRQTIRETAPEAVEVISYGIPAFKLHGKGLVSFAGWKHHIAVYPLPAGDAAFRKAISPFKAAKASVHFPIGQPIPHDLVRQIAEFLIRERHRKES